jgi:apolipoprotein N-acyltransferase
VRQTGATGDADEPAAEATAGPGVPGPVLAASASTRPAAPTHAPDGAGAGSAGAGTAGAGRAGADTPRAGAGRAGAGTARAGTGLRTWPATGLAVAGGLALAAAFPPTGIWPLAAAGPALLVIALWRRSLRGSFLVGLGFGFAFFIPLLSWLINVAWYAWAALAIAEAVIFAVFAIGQRLMMRLPGWPVPVAAWWVGVEAVRDRWPYAFPWGRLAMSQAQAPTVRWVKFGGPPLLTFLVALAGATLAWLVLAERPVTLRPALPRRAARPPEPLPRGTHGAIRRRAVPALAFAASAGLALAGGLLPSGAATAASPATEVAAVQGNVPHSRTLQKLLEETTVTGNHASATEQLAAQVKAGSRPAPDLVIWPEDSADIDPSTDPYIYATIADAVAAINRPVLIGTLLENPLRNAGQLWLPGRGPVAIYVKRQLVPFGEYIPFRSLIDTFSSLPSLQPVNFTAGHKAVVFRIGKIRLGDVICYEVGFDNLVSSEVTAGANLLTEQTNDADFEVDGQLGETLQQLAMAQIRAIEFDRSMVVAGTTGVSAIIAPDGRMLARSRTWQRAVLEERVPLLSNVTLAERLGEWPEIVFSALAVAALVAAAAGEFAAWRRWRRAG